MATRILNELVIDKIAAVDFPCQEHATVTIMKRKDDVQKMTAEDLGKLADLFTKQVYMSVAPYAALDDDDDDDNAAEDFDTALTEVLSYQMDWKIDTQIQDMLSPLCDALRKSITSICKDPSMDQNMRLLSIRNSVGQFLTAIQNQYQDLQLPQQISNVVLKREAHRNAEIAVAKLRLDVLKARTNSMLASQEGAGGGTMPKAGRVSRNSQPMNKIGWTDEAR